MTKDNTINAGPRRLTFLIAISSTFLQCSHEPVTAENKNLVVRIAKLQIDPAQLQNYNAALKEEIEDAVQVEPGVLNLYAVAEKDNPTSITVFEIYANADAFESHLETPHFKKYKSATAKMVTSLELHDTVPIVLAAK